MIIITNIRVGIIVNKIKFFKYEKLKHITTQFFTNYNHFGKSTMKAKVTILDISYNAYEEANNFISLMDFESFEDPSIATLRSWMFVEDDQEKIMVTLKLYFKGAYQV